MIQEIRHCPGCGWDEFFQQCHAAAGTCPDSPDGDCPEWFCTDCGAALLIGFDAPLHAAVGALELRERVA
jgi:hypothetical protein